MRIALFALLVGLYLLEGVTAIHVSPIIAAQFVNFKKTFNKTYQGTEEHVRLLIFADNMKKAAQLQAKNPLATFGVNKFSDLTAEEFRSWHNGFINPGALNREHRNDKIFSEQQVRDSPKKIDWRSKGAVTDVKDQGQCGSCWAFSTTGGIEGQWFLAGNDLVSLSEQQLVSCDTIDSGCAGGLMNQAYEWILNNQSGKLATEESYPYVSGQGNQPACNSSLKLKDGATIHGHIHLPHDEDQMLAFVGSKGPLSIAVDATAWQSYTSGVMMDCDAAGLDHGVLIVGYSMSHNPPYWIVKNSWGSDWGEKGYIRIHYGSDQCFLTHYPVSAIVPQTQAPGPTVWPKGTFQHNECDDNACTICDTWYFKEGECINWDGVSYKAWCGKDILNVTQYPRLDCAAGGHHAEEFKLDTCGSSSDMTYVSISCPKDGATAASSFSLIQHERRPKRLFNRKN